MVQKQEALKCIEHEIAQQVEIKRRIGEDLIRLGVVLTPHRHIHLPIEILSSIFTLLALGYGPMAFPLPEENARPQLVISHVCSHWRKVALRTPKLWSNTHFMYQSNGSRLARLVNLHQRWLLRAREFPVSLTIQINYFVGGGEFASFLQSILFSIQVKRLSLQCLTYQKSMELLSLPEATVSGLLESELVLNEPDDDMNVNMSNTHPLITQARSVTLWSRHCYVQR